MLNHRQMLTPGAVSAGMLALPHAARAGEPEFTYSPAGSLPLSRAMNSVARRAAVRVRSRTGGRFGPGAFMPGPLRAGRDEAPGLPECLLPILVPVAAIKRPGFSGPA